MKIVSNPNYNNQYCNKLNNNPRFGMAFVRCANDNFSYLRAGFGKSKIAHLGFKKAISLVDRKCDKFKDFALVLTPDGASIKVISLTDIGGIKLIQKYGDNVIVLDNNYVYPNFAQRVDDDLEKLKERIKPNNLVEKLFFNIYGFVHKQFAKIYVATHPYEKLPPNFRKGVDIMVELEKSIQAKAIDE